MTEPEAPITPISRRPRLSAQQRNQISAGLPALSGPDATPYRGLVPYSEDDAAYFFGRDAEREVVVANLLASRLTLFYGASGVGKSSVLRAGVVRLLREQARINTERRGRPEFVVVMFNAWRDDPVTGLEELVEETAAPFVRADAREVAFPADPTRALAEFLDAWTERIDADLLVILDQFEEYFVYHDAEDGPGSLLFELPRALERRDLRVNFLISIREDALALLDRFKGRIPNLFQNYLRIEHLTPAAAHDAIVRPVEAYNRTHDATAMNVEPALAQAVLTEVTNDERASMSAPDGPAPAGAASAARHDAIEAPYLQMVMTRLWDEERAARSSMLRVETLRRLGGAQSIVRTHLDQALEGFEESARDVAASAFRYLVTPSGSKIAHTAKDLAEYTELPVADVERVLERLAAGDARVLRRVSAADPDAPPRYEIFHDVLSGPILDWRRRHDERRRIEEATRLARARAEEHATRRRRRDGLTAVGVFGAVLIAVAVVVALGYRKQTMAERATNVELKRAREDLQVSNALSRQRYDRIRTGQSLKQKVLMESGIQFLAGLLPEQREHRIPFRVEAKPSYVSDGRQFFVFSLEPDRDAAGAAIDSIAFITYKMDHPTFRNYLLATGPARQFRASYEGWGCLSRVIALIEWKDPDRPPTVAEFDMCAQLGWQGP